MAESNQEKPNISLEDFKKPLNECVDSLDLAEKDNDYKNIIKFSEELITIFNNMIALLNLGVAKEEEIQETINSHTDRIKEVKEIVKQKKQEKEKTDKDIKTLRAEIDKLKIEIEQLKTEKEYEKVKEGLILIEEKNNEWFRLRREGADTKTNHEIDNEEIELTNSLKEDILNFTIKKEIFDKAIKGFEGMISKLEKDIKTSDDEKNYEQALKLLYDLKTEQNQLFQYQEDNGSDSLKKTIHNQRVDFMKWFSQRKVKFIEERIKSSSSEINPEEVKKLGSSGTKLKEEEEKKVKAEGIAKEKKAIEEQITVLEKEILKLEEDIIEAYRRGEGKEGVTRILKEIEENKQKITELQKSLRVVKIEDIKKQFIFEGEINDLAEKSQQAENEKNYKQALGFLRDMEKRQQTLYKLRLLMGEDKNIIGSEREKFDSQIADRRAYLITEEGLAELTKKKLQGEKASQQAIEKTLSEILIKIGLSEEEYDFIRDLTLKQFFEKQARRKSLFRFEKSVMPVFNKEYEKDKDLESDKDEINGRFEKEFQNKINLQEKIRELDPGKFYNKTVDEFLMKNKGRL